MLMLLLPRNAIGANSIARIKGYSCSYANTINKNYRNFKINHTERSSWPLTIQKHSSTTSSKTTTIFGIPIPRIQLKWKWKALAKGIKYIRIPLLVLSVYGIGYQQGIVDYSRDPKLKEEEILTGLLYGIEATPSDVKVARDGDFYRFKTIKNPHLRQVSKVGHRIIQSAHNYVDMELRTAQENAMEVIRSEETDKEIDQEELLEKISEHENIAELMRAKSRLDGKWQYLLVKSRIPNAFVSEVLPNRIFVTTAMLETFIANEDEMALILGHEVSHLLYGHMSERLTVQRFLLALEVLLLSIDPTDGFLSIAFMTFLSRGRSALSAANSRDHERMADELGIKLAAMSCYDTSRATEVFQKMHKYDIERMGLNNAAVKGTHFFDSHPPSLERYESLLEFSKEENSEKYEENGDCASLRNVFRNALSASK